MNIAEFKRIKAKIPDLKSKPYQNMSIQSSLEGEYDFTDVEEYLSNCPSDKLDKIFNVGKSEREKNTGLSSQVIEDLRTKRNSGFYLKIDESFTEDDFIMINYSFDGKNDRLFDLNIIEVAENVKATVVVNYEGGQKDSFRNGFYYINLGQKAELDFVKVQDLSDHTINVESAKVELSKRAKFNYYPVELGSSLCLTSCSTYQSEDWTEVSIFPLFFVDETRRADYEQNLIINGKNSLGIIRAKGCVKDTGHKVFRGNVFLNKGCKRSIGRFSDKSVIMNNGIKAHTIPTIFCDEDDVIGEHAGSFEPLKISELYYLMSRGFNKKTAKKILVKSSFLTAINLIKNDELRNNLIDKIDYKLDR